VKLLPWAAGALVLLAALVVYNWVSRKDWDAFIQDSEVKLAALENDLSAVQKEQAELARNLNAAAAAAVRYQREYESRMAREADEKPRAMWGIRRMGSVITQLAMARQRKKLDVLRSIINEFGGSVIRSLRAIQQIISPRQGDPSGFKPPDDALQKAARDQLALLEPAIKGTIELLAQMKIELTDDASSLKDQELKIQRLMPAGVSRADPMTDQTIKAVESVLKANERTQELLARLDKSTDRFGKVVYRASDIIKAQSAFMTAVK